MIHTIPASVLVQCEQIKLLDPFQFSIPSWKVKPWLTIQTGGYTMAVKITSSDKVPTPKVYREPVVPEITEVLDALKKASPTSALEVSLSEETFKRYSKNRKGAATNPAKVLASALKRRFTVDGLQLIAYTPDGITVYVMTEKEAAKLRK